MRQSQNRRHKRDLVDDGIKYCWDWYCWRAGQEMGDDEKAGRIQVTQDQVSSKGICALCALWGVACLTVCSKGQFLTIVDGT